MLRLRSSIRSETGRLVWPARGAKGSAPDKLDGLFDIGMEAAMHGAGVGRVFKPLPVLRADAVRHTNLDGEPLNPACFRDKN